MTDDKMDFNPDPVDYIRQAQARMLQEGQPLPDPERDHLIRQEWEKEWAQCLEDYKDIPLPEVTRIIKQRAIAATNRAKEAHVAMKARRAAAKDGNT